MPSLNVCGGIAVGAICVGAVAGSLLGMHLQQNVDDTSARQREQHLHVSVALALVASLEELNRDNAASASRGLDHALTLEIAQLSSDFAPWAVSAGMDACDLYALRAYRDRNGPVDMENSDKRYLEIERQQLARMPDMAAAKRAGCFSPMFFEPSN
jgi:hypothetical protein